MKKALLTLIIIFFASTAFAEGDLPINGYLLLNYSARTTDNDDFLVAEERLQLELAKDIYEPVSASFFVKVDFIKDELADEDGNDGDSTRTDTREAYVTLTFDKFDLKIGRQITTWGAGDLLFINDIFPKDWTSLISGRPLQYLKIGTSSIKIGHYGDLFNTDLIITPYFEGDELPDGQPLYAYMPPIPPGISNFTEELPEKSVSNSELSLKLSKYAGDNDIALYFHRTYWRTPHLRFSATTAETWYPELLVYGASLQRSLFGGVAKLEGGYYQSREDERGTDPLIKNSERRYLLGFEKEILSELTLGLQYYSEIMHDYNEYVDNLPFGAPKRDEVRRVVSVRLTKFMKYQTLRLSLYTQYSPSDDDYYINPEIKYNIADNLYAALGTNVFGGKDEYTMYGQFDGNDNVYAQLRYDF